MALARFEVDVFPLSGSRNWFHPHFLGSFTIVPGTASGVESLNTRLRLVTRFLSVHPLIRCTNPSNLDGETNSSCTQLR